MTNKWLKKLTACAAKPKLRTDFEGLFDMSVEIPKRRFWHDYYYFYNHLTAAFPGQPFQYQKGKTNLDFAGARDSEWQWHQLGHMQVCTSLQTDNHASTPPVCFLQARCPSCHTTNSVKALKAFLTSEKTWNRLHIVERQQGQHAVCWVATGWRRTSALAAVEPTRHGQRSFWPFC